jgi:hypothetical protein
VGLRPLRPVGPGDGERARTLLGEALATARDLGLGTVERRAGALLGETPRRWFPGSESELPALSRCRCLLTEILAAGPVNEHVY